MGAKKNDGRVARSTHSKGGHTLQEKHGTEVALIVTFDRHSHRGPPNANLRWPLDGAARPHRGGVSI